MRFFEKNIIDIGSPCCIINEDINVKDKASKGIMVDYASLCDTELLELAASGDRLAEEILVERYRRQVLCCARPLVLAGGDTEDLVQEGMFGLISAIRRYEPNAGASFKTFAEHCIRMRLISAVKSASRLKHFPLNDGVSLEQLSDDFCAQLSAIPENFRYSPEVLVLARESKEELYEAFSRCLSKLEKNVLSLYLDGYSYNEIGKRLNKDSKAVDNAVQRIRRKLARNLNHGDISLS